MSDDYDSVPFTPVGKMKVGPMELSNDQREQPTTTVELPAGVKATVQGPSTTQVQPGGSVAADAATAMLPPWAKVGTQMTAIAVIIGLFSWGYFRNEDRFDAAMRQIQANTEARAADLKAFRDWTEGRADKAQEREDTMRSKFWQALGSMSIDLKILLMQHGLLNKATEMKKEKR